MKYLIKQGRVIDPVNKIDPDGLFAVPQALVVAGGALIIGAAYYATLPAEQQQAMAEDIEKVIEKIKGQMQKKISESRCEVRQPPPGDPPGYDPENPPPDPNAPLWKKIIKIILKGIRAANP